MNEQDTKILIKYYEYVIGKPNKRFFWIKNIVKKLVYNFPLIYSEPILQPCDILFLHINKSEIYRYAPLKQNLANRGFSISDEVILSAKEIILNRYLTKTKRVYPNEFTVIASYAKYIVKKYQPKILITSIDSSIISVFLRNEMLPFGKVINIAHGVTVDNHLFSMLDFDYLFLFGQRSLENLMRNPVLYGSTKVVLTGSPYITPDFTLPVNYDKKNVLFFSSWMPEESRHILFKNFNMVINWAKAHPEYNLYVKLHPSPLDDPLLWRKLSHGISNITILDKNIGMKEALTNVSLVIVCWSCGSFEASILERPTVVVNDSDFEDNFLYLEKYFLPRARNVAELHRNIINTLENYEYYLNQSNEFIKYHFEHVHDSIEYISNCIESIVKGVETFPTIELHENVRLLED